MKSSDVNKVWINLCSGGEWENVNGCLQYMPLSITHSLKLPLTKLTYKGLILRIAKKLSLEPKSGFRLSYVNEGVVLAVNDDDDVDRFISYVNVYEKVVTVYVVEPRSIQVGSGTGSNQVCSTAPVYDPKNVHPQGHYEQFAIPETSYHHQQFAIPPSFQYHTTQFSVQPPPYMQPYQNMPFFSNPNPNPPIFNKPITNPNTGFHIEQLDDCELIEDKNVSTSHIYDFDDCQDQFFEDNLEDIWGETKQAPLDYHNVDYVSSQIDDNLHDIWGESKQTSPVDDNDLNEIGGVDLDDIVSDDANDVEDTVVIEPVDQPFYNSYDPEKEDTVVKKPVEQRAKFWLMPELLDIPEDELVKIPAECYTKVIRIKKDDCFDTKEDLKIALYTKCVEDGYQLVVDKSSKDRFETKCRHDKKCTWRVVCKRIKNCEMFQVRKLIDKHTCSRSQVFPNHRQANKKVLGALLAELMFVNGRIYRGHEIMTDMNARFKISISYSQAWRAKCYALELLRGSPEASFAQLPAYCHNLKRTNPGSVTHIKTDTKGRFELLFIAIGAAIRSFVGWMRPVIIVDGAHLKGRYLGTNLLAVGMDANNGILPIAYGVGKSETTESWIWFMTHLRDSIGPVSNLTIISDRANSIDMAIRSVFPSSFHGLCGVHLFRNLKSRCASIKHHKSTYWKAVKAYREVDFNRHIRRLRTVLPQCCQTLEDVGFERWSRVHALGARYGFMTSNSAESINSLSRHSRKLPITMLMEFFRASVQDWYYRKRELGATLEHHVTPWTEKMIAKRVVKSTSWRVLPCSNTVFEVKDNNLNGVVDLEARTCTCGKWQISGVPCGHVIKVAGHLNQDDTSIYALECYTSEVYRQTYAEIIYPIPHPSEWEILDDLQTVLPPSMDKRLPGRPKNRDRIPSKGEDKRKITCSRCKESGHTRMTCVAPVPSQSSYPPTQEYGSSSYSKGKTQSQSLF